MFSSPKFLADIFPGIENLEEELNKIKSEFSNPEEINLDKEGHPSSRIRRLVPFYNKTLHGSIAIKRMGLDILRKECRHFNLWLTKLENQ